MLFRFAQDQSPPRQPQSVFDVSHAAFFDDLKEYAVDLGFKF
jgi:hypothetical protein